KNANGGSACWKPKMKARFVGAFIAFLTCMGGLTQAALVDITPGSLIMDDEMETEIQEWLQQLFTAAGLTQYQPKVHLIALAEKNAFASVGGNIWVFTGLITKCDHVG